MDQRHDLIMQIDGMTCEGCVNAVTRIVRSVDPEAEVAVDLAHDRARIQTRAQALTIADALGRGGYDARAMTL